MKRTILALALVATTFGAFAQNTTPAAKTATTTTTTTETAKPKHHKKAVKKAVKTEAKPVEAKKPGK
jgi:ABC-type glycerol-3-phosphate transport system substrate-binding protein